MRLKKINFVACLLGMIMFCVPFGCPYANAKSCGGGENNCGGEVLSKEIYVSDTSALLQALDNVSAWGKIFLKNDINMSGITLKIKKSIVLDLNGHSIFVDQNSSGIVVESKQTEGKKKIVKEYSSDYIWDEKEHKVKKPFFGGDGYKLTVIDYESGYEYNDDIYVTIQNGSITREVGKDGKDGEANTWLKCSGENGETPKAPLNINSGAVSLVNMKVIGGNGGNGGNGANYPWPHLPFSGGCGADGGDGGNGGSAIFILRREVRLIMDKNAKISSGRGGKGGKGGEPSSEFWFYKSKGGSAGKSGKSKPNIEYKYKKQKNT